MRVVGASVYMTGSDGSPVCLGPPVDVRRSGGGWACQADGLDVYLTDAQHDALIAGGLIDIDDPRDGT